jgi:hypothetical protein
MPAMKHSKTPMRPLPRVTIVKVNSDYATWFAPTHASVAGWVMLDEEDGRWYARITDSDLPSQSGKTARAAAIAALDAWEASQRPAPAPPILCFAAADAPDYDIDAIIARQQRRCDHCGGHIAWEMDGAQCARCVAMEILQHLRDDHARRQARIIYVTACDVPGAMQPGWRIVNAPRPLIGSLRWQGPYLTGIHYAAGDPAEFGTTWEQEDAYTVRILTADECAALLDLACQRARLSVDAYCATMQMTPGELANMLGLPWPAGKEG